MMNKIKDLVKTIDPKKLVKVATFVFGLLLIIVSTLVDAGLDPNQFNFYTWISNTLILVGIMVYGLVMGESIGSDRQMGNVNGLYQHNLNEYNEILKQVEPIIIYFSQFYYKFLARQIRSKKIDYLKNHSVNIEYCEIIVDYITQKDIWELKQPSGILITLKDKSEFVIPQQNEEQIEAIQYVIDGKVKIKEPKPNYYLNAFDTTNVKYELEEPEHLENEIKINKTLNRAFKIGSSLVISIVWSMLTVNEFMGGDDPIARASAWNKLVSRIVALFTSFVSGWSSSVIDTKLRARKLKGKYLMLTRFKTSYDKKEFVPISSQAQARAIYEEEKKKEVKVEIVPCNETLQIEEKPVIITPIVKESE